MGGSLIWYVRPMNEISAWYLSRFCPRVRDELCSRGDPSPQAFALGVYEGGVPLHEFAEFCFSELGSVLEFVSYCRRYDEQFARRMFTYNVDTLSSGIRGFSSHDIREWSQSSGAPESQLTLCPTLVCRDGEVIAEWSPKHASKIGQ